MEKQKNLTPEQVQQLSRLGRITSLRPFAMEWREEIATKPKHHDFIQHFVNLMSEYLEENPELTEIEPGTNVCTPEFFVDFFTRILRIDEEEQAEPVKKSVQVLLNEKTALSIISDEKIRKSIKGLALPGQMYWDFDEDGSGSVAIPAESQIKKVLNQKKDTQGYNVVLLQTIGTGIEAVYKLGNCSDEQTVHIPRVGLQNHLGIKIRKPKKEDIDFLLRNRAPKTDAEKKQYQDIQKSYPFWIELVNLSKAGTMQTKDGFYTVFNFEGYNEAEDTIDCSSPFLFHAYMDVYNNAIEGPRKNNEISYKIVKTVPPVVKGSLYTLKNKNSVEIIEELLYRLADRGTQADAKWKPHYNYKDNKKITIKVTYKDLIKSCPALHHCFYDPITKKDGTTSEPDAQYRRMVLKRAVFGENKLTKKAKKTESTTKRENTSLIEAVLRDHTTLYNYYVDFNIKVDPISMKALNRTGITITHCGKSGDYQNDPELHSPEIIEN